ncbi:MAG: 4Fe-4S binding protein [Negativicutes bacterium]|nr:4Fe-4S binding protein [Negativicutes bacterium]
MKLGRVRIICFSPTGSSRKIAEAVASAVSNTYELNDLTLPSARNQYEVDFTDELVILAAPVYFGRVARTAVEIFTGLQGEKTPVVLLAVYGNRHFDDALVELNDIAVSGGFMPIAAAAFVATHSFDSPEYPIASGRPDIEDLAQAKAFADMVLGKIKTAGNFKAIESITVPGNIPYKEYGGYPVAPVSTDACMQCGTCVRVCPKGAISINDKIVTTDQPACILCHACVKECPAEARVFVSPQLLSAYQRLNTLLVARREPEFFV